MRLLGGLHVLGTERHEARRIDNQLRGRAGRQGDPGSSRFFVSLEDELMRRFGGASIAGLMDRLGLEEDVPLEHPWVTRAIENAQQKVEAYNFDIRKHVVEYDDVLNRQRDVIYGDRDRVLFEDNLKPLIMEWVEETLVGTDRATLLGGDRHDWDLDALRQQVERIFPMPENFDWEDIETPDGSRGSRRPPDGAGRGGLRPQGARARARADAACSNAWLDAQRHRSVCGSQHLTAIDDLREGIGLRAYGQRDPLIEYKVEAARMFDDLQATIRAEVVTRSTTCRCGSRRRRRRRRREAAFARRGPPTKR